MRHLPHEMTWQSGQVDISPRISIFCGFRDKILMPCAQLKQKSSISAPPMISTTAQDETIKVCMSSDLHGSPKKARANERRLFPFPPSPTLPNPNGAFRRKTSHQSPLRHENRARDRPTDRMTSRIPERRTDVRSVKAAIDMTFCNGKCRLHFTKLISVALRPKKGPS